MEIQPETYKRALPREIDVTAELQAAEIRNTTDLWAYTIQRHRYNTDDTKAVCVSQEQLTYYQSERDANALYEIFYENGHPMYALCVPRDEIKSKL